MKTNTFLVWLIIFMAGASLVANEGREGQPPVLVLNPLSDLGTNSLALFSASRLGWHLSALAFTGAIIQTGLDQRVHNFFATHIGLDSISTPGVYIGYLLPAVLGGGLWVSGLLGHTSELTAVGSAVCQATILAVVYSSFLKAFSGRPAPMPLPYPDKSASAVFRPGFLRGGIHYGWPSGHMLTNTAAVVSLLSFYRGSTPLKVIGIAYLGYMFASVLAHERSSMHWFSDAVAGTLLGYSIGSTIGKSFRKRFEGERDKRQSGHSFQFGLGINSLSLTLTF